MPQRFSHKLRMLDSGSAPKTVQALMDTFEDKSFAVLFVLLMALPALPLPTGGVSHVFELIVMLLAGELVFGRRVIWLPRKWLHLELPPKFWQTLLPRLIRLIEKVEARSRPRLRGFVASPLFARLSGLVVFVLALLAFLAPPFSGLDTLLGLGVVLIALGILLDDVVVWIAGLVAGSVGIALVVVLGRAVFRLF